MKTVLYSRISTSDKGQDISNQEQAAKAAGWALDEIYKEIGISGSVPPMSRPEFSRMMSELPRGSKVIVSAQDRLTRSTKDLLIFLDEIKDLGISLYILQYPNIDCASAIGIMVLTIAASISAMELANLKYRVKMGLERTVASGTILGKKEALSPSEVHSMMLDIKHGKTYAKAAEKYKVSVKTVQRYSKKYSDENSLTKFEEQYNMKTLQHKENQLKRALR